MRSFKTSLALAVALVLFSDSNALFAQTETQDSGTVEIQNQADGVVVGQEDAEPVKVVSDDVAKESVVGDTPSGDTPSGGAPSGDAASDVSSSDDASGKADTPPAAEQQTASPPVQTASPPVAANTKPGRFALTFDDLKFDMEKTEAFDREMLTSKINGYHGGKVKIRGYIRPNFKQSGITKFIFVRDNKECCFGPQAAIFDNVLVRLERGASVNYTVRPVTIEGDFVLKEYRGDDGNVWSLYRMYNAKIK